MSDEPEVGDVVTVRDEDRRRDDGPWEVTNIEGDTAELETVYQPYRYEPVADLNVEEKGGHES